MSATPVTVAAMCQLMAKHRLRSTDDVKAIFQLWKNEANQPDDAEQFRRFLVSREYVTEYQANLLLHGRNDGYMLDQYRILDRIGQGRMAGVYSALTPQGDRVALKVLPPSKSKNPQLLARFQREARFAVDLDHPNVVRTLHFGEIGGLHYIVMEHLEGETLEDVLKRRAPLDVGESVRIIHYALLGLQHLHEKGLVHRDMKPANVMLSPKPGPGEPDTTANCTVKILDIGLGRRLFDESVSEPDQETQLTEEGVLLGTPDYWAPEQARNAHTVDIRADIYSLGCVLYHCLTGQPPFPDTHMLNQMIRHVQETARPLRELNPLVPDGLQQVVNFMLAKDPGQRYPTPERAARALQIFLAAAQPAAPTEDAMAEKKPQPKPEPGAPIPTGKLVPNPVKKARPAEAPVVTPAAPVPAPVPAPITAVPPAQPAYAPVGDYDVELVAIPCPPPGKVRKPGDPRSLFDFDTRDFIMLGLGVGGTIIAVLAGLILAKALTGKKADDPDTKGKTERPPARLTQFAAIPQRMAPIPFSPGQANADLS